MTCGIDPVVVLWETCWSWEVACSLWNRSSASCEFDLPPHQTLPVLAGGHRWEVSVLRDVLELDGTGGKVFWVGPPPAEELQELGISSSDFSEEASQGGLGQKIPVSTASEFLCCKNSTLPSQGCSPRFSSLSNFFLKCPGSPGLFPPLLSFYEPPIWM